MVQLKRAGKLKDLTWLVVEKMVYMQDLVSIPMNKSTEAIIQEHVAGYSYPVAFQFSIGHQAPNLAFPHGEIGTLRVENDKAGLAFKKSLTGVGTRSTKMRK